MTVTSTRELVSLTRVEVRRPPGGGRCEVVLSCEGPVDRPVVRPMLLSSDDHRARVSLVPEGALLLAGDAIVVEIFVGPGAGLDLIEPGGTVAYAMNGGSASWDVDIEVGAAGSLTWAGEPFVVAEGARVERRTRVRVGWDARLALREVLVLGRHGEGPGRLRQSWSAEDANAVPILSESLDVGPDMNPLLLGAARVIGTVVLLGDRLRADHPTTADSRFDLEAEGTVVRHLARDAHLVVPHDLWRAARAAGVGQPSA